MEHTNPLKTWLKSTGRTAKWAAEQIGVSQQHMSRLINGKAEPTRTVILALENISQGGVPATAWVKQ